MDGRKRSDIKPGARVQVVQKQDQRSGKLTEGVVDRILTNSSTHPHGIKVRLVGGVVGRVKTIIPNLQKASAKPDSETAR
ncbi:MAG: YwbE family protein [Desulfobacteraceae bacterium]|nr:MAG: YwbE family protein [Desulfobacteraceae bacterium]